MIIDIAVKYAIKENLLSFMIAQVKQDDKKEGVEKFFYRKYEEIKVFIILGIWLILVFYGVEIDRGGYQIQPFTQDKVVALRGICAIEIMIGHLGLPEATNSLVLFGNRKAGVLFVGIFFALSGYGLMHSYTQKPDYLRDFLYNRILKVLIPAYLVFLITGILKIVVSHEIFSLKDMLSPQCFWESTNWYVWEMLLLYLVFYFTMKYMKAEWKIIGIMIFLICFVVAAFGLKMDNPWYGSTLYFGLIKTEL